ncbi:MAG: hypothetical protein RIF46_08500 [Cyclobacteriaceae bacterium]
MEIWVPNVKTSLFIILSICLSELRAQKSYNKDPQDIVSNIFFEKNKKLKHPIKKALSEASKLVPCKEDPILFSVHYGFSANTLVFLEFSESCPPPFKQLITQIIQVSNSDIQDSLRSVNQYFYIFRETCSGDAMDKKGLFDFMSKLDENQGVSVGLLISHMH